MSRVFVAHGAIGRCLVPSPSSAIVSTVGASSPLPATRSLIEASILLVWRRPGETLLCWVMLSLFLQVVDCMKWSHVSLPWGWWWPRGPACLPPQVVCCLWLL
jgi:hypothetical protein